MSAENIAEILRKCEIFSELSDEEIQSIDELGRMIRFKAGDTIYEQGSLGTNLYVLAEGQVALERRADLGNSRQANVTVFVLKEHSNRRLLGGWSWLVGEPHIQMCSAICQKTTRVACIRSSDLREAMIKHTGIQVKILKKLVLLLRDRIDSSFGAFEVL